MDDKKQLSKMAHIGLKTVLLSLGISIVLFIPFLPLGLVFSKGIILTLGAALGLMFYFLDCISVGRFVLPRGNVWKVFLGLVLVAAGTSFFVPNPLKSFLGSGFDTFTVSTLAVSFVYFFLINLWGHGINFTKYIFKTIFITGFISVIFSILQFAFNITGRFPKLFVSLGGNNLVGSFHDLAFVLGLFVVLLTVSLESNFWRGYMKIVSTVAVVLSLALLFVINYTLLWYVIGVSGLALLIVQLMPEPAHSSVPTPDGGAQINNLIAKKRSFSVISFLIVFCAFIGIIGANSISMFFARPPMNFIVSESRPSIMSTLTVTKYAYYYEPITGAGLNRFNQAWEAGKHKILNGRLMGSEYWGASFDIGSSVFLTFITTLGSLGAAVFVWLMVLIGKHVANLFSKKNLSRSRSRDVLVYGFTSVYAFLVVLFDVPNTALFIVLIALFAMVVVRNQSMNGINPREFWFINDSRHSFFGILGIIAAIILLAFVTFVIMSAFYAGYLVNRAALKPVANGGILESEAILNRAISVHNLDDYARLAVDAHLVGISTLVQDENQSQESLTSALTAELTNAVNNAKLAIAIDPENYKNYSSLLKVQETVFQLGDSSGYQDAIDTSNKILTLSPNNVGVIFRQAKVAAIAKNYAAAYEYIDRIIAINPSFVDAYILRSQIALLEGNPDKAISQIDQAISVNTNSAVLQYQKGLIYINQKNYSAAVTSFETALRLSPRSLDVYSSLALAYEKLGQKDSVLRVLNTARGLVSDKTQIDSLIEKVTNGGLLSNDAVIVSEEKETDSKEKTPATR